MFPLRHTRPADLPERFECEGFADASQHPSTWQHILQAKQGLLSQQKTSIIQRLQHEGYLLQQERGQLANMVAAAPPLNVLETGYKLGVVLLICWLFLAAADFSLIRVALEPWQLGLLNTLLASLGVTVLGFSAMDTLLTAYAKQRHFDLVLAAAGLFIFLYIAMMLGVMRAERFIEQQVITQDQSPAVEIVADQPAPAAGQPVQTGQPGYYARASQPLKVIFALAALAIALVGGLAFHQGLELVMSPFLRAHRRLERINVMLPRLAAQLKTWQQIEQIFASSYQIGVHRALGRAPNPQQRDKRAALVAGVALLLLLLLTLASVNAFGAPQSASGQAVVVVLDLSTSSSAVGADGQSALHRNCAAVWRFVQTLEPCTEVVVVGITDASFQRPLEILRARVGCDRGFFGEKLRLARQTLEREVGRRCGQLKSKYQQTDVIGALFLAKDFLQSRKLDAQSLVIFSDMRHVTKGLNLESPARLDVEASLKAVKTRQWVPQLQNVQVAVHGVHAADKDVSYWKDLETFWRRFFEMSGAHLITFSSQRR